MLIRTSLICVTLVSLFGFGATSWADDLEQMSPEVSQLYAQHLSEKFNKENGERQAKFDVDPSQASGLHSGQDGIIIVPAKGLKEGTVDPAVESECGSGLCYIFMSPCFSPVIDGKPVDAKKLRSIKFDNGQGEVREAVCLLVTVKHVEGDDWRLYCYGPDKSPVVNSQFGLASDGADKPLAMKIRGAKDKKANLELTLHKKYSASFAIGNK